MDIFLGTCSNANIELHTFNLYLSLRYLKARKQIHITKDLKVQTETVKHKKV